MIIRRSIVAMATLAASACLVSGAQPSSALDARFEALRRLKGMDLNANPTLRAAVLRILEQTRGTPKFVEIVRDFSLPDQQAGLIEVASNPDHPDAGAEAVRLVLKSGHASELAAAINRRELHEREALVRALANSSETQALPLLVTVLRDPLAPASIRETALNGIVQTEAGCRELLQLASGDALPESVKAKAGIALARVRWPEIREQASNILPAGAAQSHDLPSIEALLQEAGDPVRGATIFRSETAGCARCHRVGSEGVDFGPALTDIGSKLGREALYQAILEPSAGISFGYEAWSIETRDGEEFTGIIVSETPQELALKLQSGVITRLQPSQILHRQRLEQSIMPTGLGGILERKDLVDLVAYLTTLRVPKDGTTEERSGGLVRQNAPQDGPEFLHRASGP